ncbi:AAA family ATPase [Winogradskyella ludwigii]|uniref:AAA family ATPase n=1 Tax=Winogradskyella ludwigii TaxID=2686076 RepID=UPI0015CD9C7E|nr:AAA family ATPase [Winogradskyella ludwigii]
MNIQLTRNLAKELTETHYTSDKAKIDRLSEIAEVNIFVGANNSGKSRFSRGLLKMQEHILFSNKLEESLSEIIDSLSKVENRLNSNAFISFHVNRLNQYEILEREIQLLKSKDKNFDSNIKFDKSYLVLIITMFKELLNNIQLGNREDYINNLKHLLGILKITEGILSNYGYVKARGNYNGVNVNIQFNINLAKDVNPFIQETIEHLDYILKKFIKIVSPKKIFIPTQRGAKTLISSGAMSADSNLYRSTILQTYFKEVEVNEFDNSYKNISIFTGLDLYDQVKKVRNSKRKIRKSFEKFELFLKKYFFNGKDIDIVALDGDNHLSFYIDDEDLEIHDLGDGIQAIIVLMFPIFTAENNSWIFIDEPELNLHPGMQRLFLKQILSNPEIKKKNLRFFITTHSNHLLDLTLNHSNISIYSFSKLIGKTSKDHKVLIRNVKPGDSSLMENLGVNNSSVFLANCSIWIEGITDRKYLSAFLIAYLRSIEKEYHFKEDVDFAFFEYAGSNLAHYYFTGEVSDEQKEEIKDQINAFSLSNRIYLLADKDGADKQSKHTYLKKITKDNDNIIYSHTGAVEIENILSFSILKKIIVDVLNQDAELINNIDDISESDYANIGLGGFLNNRINRRKDINLPKISDNKKTLNSRYKLKFANYIYDGVVDGEITWDMISENRYAKKITMEIFAFIDKYKDKYS